MHLEDIKRLMPEFEDVREMSLTAFQEPMYRTALQHYEQNEYREAYRLFSTINEKAATKNQSNWKPFVSRTAASP